MTTKSEQARLFFEAPERYLDKREFDIRIRAETVQEFTNGKAFDRILDIGCGNGSISLPLLTPQRRLTLLDISSNMLTTARGKIPPDLMNNVELVNEGFLTAPLEPGTYDLVLCIGVLAHVDSPADVIARIAQVLKPGGCAILEFTDSYHFMGRAVVLYHRLLNLFRPATYSLNHICQREIVQTCCNYELKASAFYRYCLPPPGSHRLFDQETLYRVTRTVFGPLNHNRSKWLGNEFIYRLERQAYPPAGTATP
jgi:2-polyprenyl-3-methyl-5-hydroxy-6-metoxy-1,4-benzoquinol methylase